MLEFVCVFVCGGLVDYVCIISCFMGNNDKIRVKVYICSYRNINGQIGDARFHFFFLN